MVEVLKGVHSINLTEDGGLGLEAWILDCSEAVSYTHLTLPTSDLV